MAQPMTRRLKTSRTATRYNQPWPVRHARGITDPELIGTSDGEVSHPIGRDRSAVAAVGRGVSILGALPGKESFRTHEPGNAIASSRAAQRLRQPRTAVGLTTAGKLLPDACAQEGVLELARTGLAAPLFPSVIAAARDEQGLAQPSYLILAAHLFDPGIPLGGASERMPSDFFSTSRCSRSLAFSARK